MNNMVVVGIDAGSEYAKVAVLKNDSVVSHYNLGYGAKSASVVLRNAFNHALDSAGISNLSVDCVAVTGKNREAIHFTQLYLPESICCARGAVHLCPSVRTVIDLGCDKCTVLRCNERGNVLRIAHNDKCASGTGRFLKAIASLFEMTEEQAGELSLRGQDGLKIEATCTVFVESEIISLIHLGKTSEDILRAVFRGFAQRIYSLILRVGAEREIMLVGGMATNIGIINALETQLGCNVVIPQYPSLVVALGAAIVGKEKCSN